MNNHETHIHNFRQALKWALYWFDRRHEGDDHRDQARRSMASAHYYRNILGGF